jgi:two-component system LytT family sensor kinase
VTKRDTRRLWLTAVAIWTLLGLIESGKAYVTARLRELPASWISALTGNMPWWYGWGLLTPLAFWLARRFRLDQRRPFGALLVHLSASLVLSFAHLGGVGALYYRTHASSSAPGLGAMLRRWLELYTMLDMLTYWAIIGAVYALDYYGRYRASEVNAAMLTARAAQLEASMTEAKLNALRMELNPHFLFNTLNAISGLVRGRAVDEAVQMLARLGELLRVSLERESAQQVPLERELSFLRLYLEIERIRFHDRLTVNMAVDPEALDALVPPLILQPIVENAVRHGVAKRPGPGEVGIRGTRQEDTLVLLVTDSGAGFPSNGGARREGVGLSNTRARLEQMYGSRARMMLENAPDGGASVTIRLPFKEYAPLPQEVTS